MIRYFKKLIPILLVFTSSFLSKTNAKDAEIRGINWFGLETEAKFLQCTWAHSVDWNLDLISSLNFNYIRLPFSVEYIMEGNYHNMDEFFTKIQDFPEISVALDLHRLHSTHQSPKPYDGRYSFDDFLSAWETVLERYYDNPSLKAVDIFNEFQSSSYPEWNGLARQTVNYIESKFPDRFVYFVGGVQWGGNLHYVDLSDLPFSDRVFYSIHKYWWSDSEPDIESKWDYSFGDIDLPIVNVGEWGFKSTSVFETDWAVKFVQYLKEKDITDSFFWTWSPNSGDTGGILYDDCTTVDKKKMEVLETLWFDNN